MRYLSILIVLVCSFAVTGCGGGGAKIHVESEKATIGQQLTDLEDAYRKGIIDKQEYERAKKRIVDGK